MSLSQANIAVVGTGHWGKNLARNFGALGALACVCDARPEMAQQQAVSNGVEARTFEAILADDSIVGVAIATPAAQHAVMALAALEAGKHVFVEKPIALDVADAEVVIRAANAKGRQLMVGHLLQYHPAFIELRTRVHRGDIGKLRYIYSNRLSLGQIRTEENTLWSFAPHDLSMILSLTGEPPETISAVGHAYLGRQHDVTMTSLTFRSGVNAHVFVSWLHPFKEQKLIVIGETGMIVFDDTLAWSSKLTAYDHEIEWDGPVPRPVKKEGRALPLPEAEPLRLECQAFLDCIGSAKPPPTGGAEALAVLKVLAAADRSIQAGRAVKLEEAITVEAGDRGAYVHPTAHVDAGVRLGAGSKVWHFTHVLAGTTIGQDCVLGQNVVVGPDVTVGNRCKIQNNVSLYKGVELEDGVFCGPSCVFTNVLTPRAEINRKTEFLSTPVRRGATIGANATIVCGHELGEYCMIAAGAVVTHDVPAFALMAGVPARRIGWVSHAGERLGDDLVCPREGRRYRLLEQDRLVLSGRNE